MPRAESPVLASAESGSRAGAGLRVLAVLIGALVVAASAQVTNLVPGSPVPITLQGFAVLLVGGVLGPRAGAAALVTYLAMGIAGLPVFAPGGVPGAARLIGPTGGYLLAFPVAAAVTGALAGRGRVTRSLLAALAGMAIIHLGGTAQLAILTGGLATPLSATLPLIAIDLVKVGMAGLMIAALRDRLIPSR